MLFRSTWLPTGKSSGGMAMSLACLFYERVGIIGFDGWWKKGLYDPEGRAGQLSVIVSWQKKDRLLYNLMEKTVFEDDLLPI